MNNIEQKAKVLSEKLLDRALAHPEEVVELRCKFYYGEVTSNESFEIKFKEQTNYYPK